MQHENYEICMSCKHFLNQWMLCIFQTNTRFRIFAVWADTRALLFFHRVWIVWLKNEKYETHISNKRRTHTNTHNPKYTRWPNYSNCNEWFYCRFNVWQLKLYTHMERKREREGGKLFVECFARKKRTERKTQWTKWKEKNKSFVSCANVHIESLTIKLVGFSL